MKNTPVQKLAAHLWTAIQELIAFRVDQLQRQRISEARLVRHRLLVDPNVASLVVEPDADMLLCTAGKDGLGGDQQMIAREMDDGFDRGRAERPGTAEKKNSLQQGAFAGGISTIDKVQSRCGIKSGLLDVSDRRNIQS